MSPRLVGVTGFTSRSEVDVALDVLPGDVQLMVGVLASSKTLRGELNKWPNRYPLRECIAGIFPEKSPRTLNLIHFSTSAVLQLVPWMRTAVEYAGENFQGFQLNIPWPPAHFLLDWKASRGDQDRYLILQIGPQAIEQCYDSPVEIAKRVKNYEGFVDRVLIDASGGLGKPLDTKFASECIWQIRQNQPDLAISVAGALSGSTVRRKILPLLPCCSDVGLDSESALRTSEDHLSLARMKAYLREAAEL